MTSLMTYFSTKETFMRIENIHWKFQVFWKVLLIYFLNIKDVFWYSSWSLSMQNLYLYIWQNYFLTLDLVFESKSFSTLFSSISERIESRVLLSIPKRFITHTLSIKSEYSIQSCQSGYKVLYNNFCLGKIRLKVTRYSPNRLEKSRKFK